MDRKITYIQVYMATNMSELVAPTLLNPGQNGTWTATVTFGQSPYHYKWYYYYPCDDSYIEQANETRIPPCGYWNGMGLDAPEITRYDYKDFKLKCVVTDDLQISKTSNILYVTVGGSLNKQTNSDMNKTDNLSAKESSISSVEQNYPNPFNPTTTIKFNLSERSFVTIKVFNSLGEEISVLLSSEKVPGQHTVQFNANNLVSGIYYYTIAANDFKETRKMILAK